MDKVNQAREAILDVITGVHAGEVLNPAASSASQILGVEFAAELKRALEQIKIAAIDERGRQVNYASLRVSRAYQEYRQICSPKLRHFDPIVLDSRQERLAFWINLYNALVLDAVISFGIHRSVTESCLGLLAFFRRAAYNIKGLRTSCDDIEHGILRGNRGHPLIPGAQFAQSDPRQDWVISPPDPRVHFALNCASRSCPPFQVFTPAHIDAQLDLAARNFVNANLSVDSDRQEISISAIFRWYQGDFGGREGVIDFIWRYLPGEKRRAWLANHRRSIRFKYQPYDWRLNETQ